MMKSPVVFGKEFDEGSWSTSTAGVGVVIGVGAGEGVSVGAGEGLGSGDAAGIGTGIGAGVGADLAHPTINNINSSDEAEIIMSSLNGVIWYLLRDVLLHLTLLILSLLLD